jgi:hypothetical protein
MMIDLCNKLVDNELVKEDLLPNIEVVSMTYDDAPMITKLLAKCFNLPSEMEALAQLLYSNAQLDKSVKAIDKRNGDIYGFLIFSIFPIHVGSPIFHVSPKLGGFLVQFKQLNGHSFILDERLRGTGIDKKMLFHQREYLNEYELIWIAVERDDVAMPPCGPPHDFVRALKSGETAPENQMVGVGTAYGRRCDGEIALGNNFEKRDFRSLPCQRLARRMFRR